MPDITSRLRFIGQNETAKVFQDIHSSHEKMVNTVRTTASRVQDSYKHMGSAVSELGGHFAKAFSAVAIEEFARRSIVAGSKLEAQGNRMAAAHSADAKQVEQWKKQLQALHDETLLSFDELQEGAQTFMDVTGKGFGDMLKYFPDIARESRITGASIGQVAMVWRGFIEKLNIPPEQIGQVASVFNKEIPTAIRTSSDELDQMMGHLKTMGVQGPRAAYGMVDILQRASGTFGSTKEAAAQINQLLAESMNMKDIMLAAKTKQFENADQLLDRIAQNFKKTTNNFDTTTDSYARFVAHYGPNMVTFMKSIADGHGDAAKRLKQYSELLNELPDQTRKSTTAAAAAVDQVAAGWDDIKHSFWEFARDVKVPEGLKAIADVMKEAAAAAREIRDISKEKEPLTPDQIRDLEETLKLRKEKLSAAGQSPGRAEWAIQQRIESEKARIAAEELEQKNAAEAPRPETSFDRRRKAMARRKVRAAKGLPEEPPPPPNVVRQPPRGFEVFTGSNTTLEAIRERARLDEERKKAAKKALEEAEPPATFDERFGAPTKPRAALGGQRFAGDFLSDASASTPVSQWTADAAQPGPAERDKFGAEIGTAAGKTLAEILEMRGLFGGGVGALATGAGAVGGAAGGLGGGGGVGGPGGVPGGPGAGPGPGAAPSGPGAGPGGGAARSGKQAATSGDPAIPANVLATAQQVALQGGPGAVEQFMRSQGYPKAGNWCGEFAAAVVTKAGGTPPKNPAIASNWRNYGSPVQGAPQPGDIAVRTGTPGGRPVPTGQTGSHVTVVEGYDPKTGTFTGIGGNQRGGMRSRFKEGQYEFRRPGDGAGAPAGTDAGQRVGVGGRDPASIRYNNPGAQYPSREATRFGMEGYGVIGGGHKIAKFPTPEAGAASNFDLLSRRYTGMTIGAAGKKWTGGYGSGVPGYDPNTIITKEMMDDPKFAIPFLRSIAGREAGRKSPLTQEQWERAHRMFREGGISTAPGGAPDAGGTTATQRHRQAMAGGKAAGGDDDQAPDAAPDATDGTDEIRARHRALRSELEKPIRPKIDNSEMVQNFRRPSWRDPINSNARDAAYNSHADLGTA